MQITYKPTFVKSFKKLEASLQEETFDKIKLFRNESNHQQLKVHKLKGRLKDYYSFSINYKYRIVFSYSRPDEADFKDIGSHDIYK